MLQSHIIITCMTNTEECMWLHVCVCVCADASVYVSMYVYLVINDLHLMCVTKDVLYKPAQTVLQSDIAHIYTECMNLESNKYKSLSSVSSSLMLYVHKALPWY